MDIPNAGVRSQKATKGVSLIIAVFTMMILAVLGLTMAMMISGDFEMNARNLESEQAFYLADSGIQESLRRLSLGDAAFDNDTEYLSRSLANGEYNVTRNINGSAVDITSNGYIPNQANYRAMRQVKALAVSSGGGLSRGIGCSGLFDWSASKSGSGHKITIDADVVALQYNGDGNGNYSQLGSDYGGAPPLAAPLPPGSGARIRGNGGSTIPMQWYHDNAASEWPSPGTRVITNRADTSGSTGSTLVVSAPNGFFTDMVGQAVRNVDHPPLANGSWADADWAVITAVTSNGLTATLDRPINNDWDDHRIRLARRYSAAAPVPLPAPAKGDDDFGATSGINYVGATISHGMGYVVDTVIDLSSSALTWQDVKIICEGDIFIKGSKSLEMTHSPSKGSGSRMHPPLATQNGNIICLDATKQADRVISGFIFSETGTVRWNHLTYQKQANWLRGAMIYGQNIFLDGDIELAWQKALVPPDEAQFGGAASQGSFTWREQ